MLIFSRQMQNAAETGIDDLNGYASLVNPRPAETLAGTAESSVHDLYQSLSQSLNTMVSGIIFAQNALFLGDLIRCVIRIRVLR